MADAVSGSFFERTVAIFGRSVRGVGEEAGWVKEVEGGAVGAGVGTELGGWPEHLLGVELVGLAIVAGDCSSEVDCVSKVKIGWKRKVKDLPRWRAADRGGYGIEAKNFFVESSKVGHAVNDCGFG